MSRVRADAHQIMANRRHQRRLVVLKNKVEHTCGRLIMLPFQHLHVR